MPRETRELIADWLILLGAVGLGVSLFLAWSHQFSQAFLAQWSGSPALRGVPRDPTAWQVYSAVDVLLALLFGWLVTVALRGTRAMRMCAMGAAALALAFALHALAVPPTDGADVYAPAAEGYAPNVPAAGPGEGVAIAALTVAIGGLVLSFTAD